MLILQNISYIHPDKNVLFDNIYLTVNTQNKIALTGNNGTGKSTLLKIITGELQPSGGRINRSAEPYYVPQIFGQYNHLSVAQVLRIDKKLEALHEILAGHVTELNLNTLDEDWTLEERCREALDHWKLQDVAIAQTMSTLSGGQKTKVFLAGITLHLPELILLDEPSNHLDGQGRAQLYEHIRSTPAAVIVVSHDRALLEQLSMICELSKQGITVYGGNYEFYTEQKQLAAKILDEDIHNKEKALRKVKEKERDTMERQQRLDSRGKKKQQKAGIARIMMNTLKNKAENSTSKLKSVHAERIGAIAGDLQDLRSALPDIDKMKFGFSASDLHKGKTLVSATAINYSYGGSYLWKENLDIDILSGERIVIRGLNGSGKTTLIRLLLGAAEPATGKIHRAQMSSVYVDQDYSLINNALSVYEQAQQFNTSALEEHEIKTRLSRFLFTQAHWDKPCSVLSGGEKMRLMLCCLTIADQAPDLIILDEPTNNLDIANIEILLSAINQYQGTLIVVSHDTYFLEHVNICRTIDIFSILARQGVSK